MFCSISGETPTDPVVSPSGAIYERKHILNYLATSPTDPITNQPLSPDDLISIQPEPRYVPPKPASSTSIPTLLATFQSEWDALALEVFALRKQLYSAREELTTALYQQDAAVRVAANAIRERDEARAALDQLTASINDPMAHVEIPVEQITKARDELFALHKSMKPVYGVPPDTSLSLEHQTTDPLPFLPSTIYTDRRELVVASSGTVVDITHEVSFDVGENVSVVSKLRDTYLVAANDKVYHYNGTLLELPIKCAGVHSLAVHPSLDLFVAVGSRSWCISDTRHPLHEATTEYTATCVDIHVDGAIFAVGTDAQKVEIFSLTDGSRLASIATSLQTVNQLRFALNGYWLMVASTSGAEAALDVVDLRKNTVVHTIGVQAKLARFAIDPSSSVVAVLGDTLTVHRYVKKGKRWLENVTSTEVERDIEGVGLEILQGHDDREFVEESRLDVVVVGRRRGVYKMTVS